MKVLVTGHLGYIGPHVVELLLEQGHYVKGIDLNVFEGSSFTSLTLPDENLIDDISNMTESDLEGFDAVIHLAGISNDPLGAFAPELTWRVNLEGTVRLAELAKRAGVPRFLFSSSCSIYGKSGDKVITELDNIAPVTDYGHTKIEVERRLSQLADRSFSPTYLRNATAYGISPRLRLDLVLNNLCAWAYATGDIRIVSDGTPWRPLVHCRDIARTFVHLVQAPRDKVHDEAFNVGSNEENFQVRDLVDVVLQTVPGSRAVYTGQGSEDSRDYRVDFTKLATTFPDFSMRYTVRTGAAELIEAFDRHGLTEEQINGPQFVRLRSLKEHFGEYGELASELPTLSSRAEPALNMHAVPMLPHVR